MGGTDDPSNLVTLTFEEHVEAHRLLCEQYPNHKGLRIAYLFMSNQTQAARKEAQRLGGAIAGPKNAAKVGKLYGAINGKKSANSPKHKEGAKRGGITTGTRNKLSGRMSELARLSNAAKWVCAECGLVTNPGSLGRHQKATLHKGKHKL